MAINFPSSPTLDQEFSTGVALYRYDGTKWVLANSGLEVVYGPESSTDNAITRFDTTTGKLVQNSTVTLDDIGNFANVNAISFDTTPVSAPTAVGSIFWDEGNGTPSVILDADVTLQLGQENIAKVYNGSGATISNGQVVAVNGAQGQRPQVTLADADSEPLSAATLGIATESITNGSEGFVCTFGLVRGLNTSAFTEGQPIWLSQTAGTFTATRPSAPAHSVFLGWVVKSNAASGEVFVHISNGWELDELHNVLITSPTTGNVLIYNASTSVWENGGPSGAIVGTTDTQTLANKRINPRVTTPGATSGNFTADGDTTDVFNCFGLTGAITFLTPSGTPVDGQRLMIRIEDNGSARAITWTTTSGAFRAVGITLPTTTVASKITYVGCVYNSTDVFWDVIAVITQA